MPSLLDIVKKEEDSIKRHNDSLPFGMISSDVNGYFIQASSRGYVQLAPGPEFLSKVYRGQAVFHTSCKPTIFRINLDDNARGLNTLRLCQFEENIAQLHQVKQYRNAMVMGRPIEYSALAVAQHYGLKTKLLDFSSSPRVAAFFAATKYDAKTNRFFPTNSNNGTGVFYHYFVNGAQRNVREQSLRLIGAQPFLRPYRQKAFAIDFQSDRCLHENNQIWAEQFKHTTKDSEEIFEYFEGDARLHPHDPVADMAHYVKAQTVFSTAIFAKAKQQSPNHNIDELRRTHLTTKCTTYSFSDEQLLVLDAQWEVIKSEINSMLQVRPVLVLKG